MSPTEQQGVAWWRKPQVRDRAHHRSFPTIACSKPRARGRGRPVEQQRQRASSSAFARPNAAPFTGLEIQEINGTSVDRSGTRGLRHQATFCRRLRGWLAALFRGFPHADAVTATWDRRLAAHSPRPR